MTEALYIDLDKIYRDQAGHSSVYGDRRISSFYTSYGIQEIDSEYCRRIQNINNAVKQVYARDRRPEQYISIRTGKLCEGCNYKDFEDPVGLNEGGSNGKVVVYIDSQGRELRCKFSYTYPGFDETTRKENPKVLLKEIKTNPHLHKTIKDNLISNLKRILQDATCN